MIVVLTSALRASGWPGPARAVAVVLPALFWAATIATAAEQMARSRTLGPGRLSALGACALAVAEWWALAPE